MGCRTRRFVFLALLCVSLIPVQVRPARRAGAAGMPLLRLAFPASQAACNSWAWWGGPMVSWYYEPPTMVTCVFTSPIYHLGNI